MAVCFQPKLSVPEDEVVYINFPTWAEYDVQTHVVENSKTQESSANYHPKIFFIINDYKVVTHKDREGYMVNVTYYDVSGGQETGYWRTIYGYMSGIVKKLAYLEESCPSVDIETHLFVHGTKGSKPKQVYWSCISRGYYKKDKNGKIKPSNSEYWVDQDKIHCSSIGCPEDTGLSLNQNVLPVTLRHDPRSTGYGLARWSKYNFRDRTEYDAPDLKKMQQLYSLELEKRGKVQTFMSKFIFYKHKINQ